MLKFEPFRESLPSKIMVPSFVVAGKKGVYERLGLMSKYKELENETEIEEDDGDI